MVSLCAGYCVCNEPRTNSIVSMSHIFVDLKWFPLSWSWFLQDFPVSAFASNMKSRVFESLCFKYSSLIVKHSSYYVFPKSHNSIIAHLTKVTIPFEKRVLDSVSPAMQFILIFPHKLLSVQQFESRKDILFFHQNYLLCSRGCPWWIRDKETHV